MHDGYRNKNFNNHFGKTEIKSAESEKELNIIIDKNF